MESGKVLKMAHGAAPLWMTDRYSGNGNGDSVCAVWWWNEVPGEWHTETFRPVQIVDCTQDGEFFDASGNAYRRMPNGSCLLTLAWNPRHRKAFVKAYGLPPDQVETGLGI